MVICTDLPTDETSASISITTSLKTLGLEVLILRTRKKMGHFKRIKCLPHLYVQSSFVIFVNLGQTRKVFLTLNDCKTLFEITPYLSLHYLILLQS